MTGAGDLRRQATRKEKPVDPKEAAFWRARVTRAVALAGTPVLVFAEEPLREQSRRLAEAFAGISVRHWWSFKTLPLLSAVKSWTAAGRGVEVVSEFELRSVLGTGIEPDRILVNGPAKHHWLSGYPLPGLRVNFDSVAEVRALGDLAAKARWSVGIRVNTALETNFEYPGVRAQFGMLPTEMADALGRLERHGVVPDVLHLHLRTNVPEARMYREAATEALEAAEAEGWSPRVLDLGGGMPPERVVSRKGAPLDAGFSLASYREVLCRLRARFRSLREIWMENGRWLASASGVLAVRVLDTKTNRGRVRTLICDGGRTLQALVATWEGHAFFPHVRRGGALTPTLLCGPTCMAFDNLGIHRLPIGVREGDVLIWLDAGAYHMSWETRFSHGLGAIVWTSGAGADLVRARESHESWNHGR